METHDVRTAQTPGKNRQWILDARPAGKLTGKEFRWNEASIPQPSAGQVLVSESLAPPVTSPIISGSQSFSLPRRQARLQAASFSSASGFLLAAAHKTGALPYGAAQMGVRKRIRDL